MDATTFLHGALLTTAVNARNTKTQNVCTSGYDLNEAEQNFGGLAESFPRYLIKIYNSIMEECSEKEVTISPSKGRVIYASKTVMREPKELAQLRFQDLPVNLQLLVFSYLDAKTLCVLACTCKYWRILSQDSVLWMSLLKSDLFQWTTISHLTHPETYLEASADITYKEIYRKCCPALQNSFQRKTKSRFQWLPFSLPFWTHQKTPTVVMFGPGLESGTSGLVKALLWDENSPFKVAGMSPGQFEGFGSGMCLQMGDLSLNLIILYSTTKKEREESARAGKQRCSKLLAQSDKEKEKHSLTTNELSFQMRELCKNTDAFIHVVDSSGRGERVNLGDSELQAMMDERWTQIRAPLLVLSCTVRPDAQSIPCASVVQVLNLRNLTRPWQVTAAHVETLDGISPGISWLLENVQNS